MIGVLVKDIICGILVRVIVIVIKHVKMINIQILKEIDLKNCTCFYFDEVIEIEDSDFANILIDEKEYKNILFYNISYKTLIVAKPLCVRFNKADLLEFLMELDS